MITIDKARLRELAEKAKQGGYVSESELAYALRDPATVLALLDAYEALQAECERVRGMLFQCEKDRDQYERDAERYRWLRRHATLDGGSDYRFPEVHAWEYKEGAEPNEQYGSLDTAIDAARQENPK